MKNLTPFLIFLLFLNLSCTPGIFMRENENRVLGSNHGFVEIIFNDDAIPEKFKLNGFGSKVSHYWECRIIINDEIYFQGSFLKSNERYKFPIPSGDIIIKYYLIARNNAIYHYMVTSFNNMWFTTMSKDLRLNVKTNDLVRLKIAKNGNSKWTMGCVGGSGIGIPWPAYYQRVALEVENVEESKSKNMDNDGTK